MGERAIDLDAPAPRRPSPPLAPPRDSQRTALLLAAGAVVVAVGIGAGVYVALDGDTTTPSSPTTPVTSAEMSSEARRDAAAAARDAADVVAVEAKRDASAQQRFATR